MQDRGSNESSSSLLANAASDEKGESARPLFARTLGEASRVNIPRSWHSRRMPRPCTVQVRNMAAPLRGHGQHDGRPRIQAAQQVGVLVSVVGAEAEEVAG